MPNTLPDLSTLSTEQKLALLDSIYSQLNIQSPEPKVEEPVKRKRGRPKKEKPVLERKTDNKPIRGKTKDAIIIDEPMTEEEKKIKEVSKLLNETRIPIQTETRRANPLVKAKCKNCGREIDVASSFPDIKNFVCCIK